jgi:hypothetical protein
VYSSMWSEAEALSEYGVVPESIIYLLYPLWTLKVDAEGGARMQ